MPGKHAVDARQVNQAFAHNRAGVAFSVETLIDMARFIRRRVGEVLEMDQRDEVDKRAGRLQGVLPHQQKVSRVQIGAQCGRTHRLDDATYLFASSGDVPVILQR